MPDELVFWMGKFEARFPTDRRYSRNHLWLQPRQAEEGVYRVGFTAYSVRLLRDVYFLEWSVDRGSAVAERQEIGQVESSKAVSSLYAPADGTILGFNDEVLSDPSAINTDGYGAGWLFDLRTAAPLLSPEDYLKHLAAGWSQTQRLIKGQINQE